MNFACWLRLFAMAAALLVATGASAQNSQCRTASVGTSTANCASEAFVTSSVAGGARPYFEGYLSGNQSPLTDSTFTLVNLNAVIKDPNGWFNAATHLYTPKLAGSYSVTGKLRCAATTSVTICIPEIRLNGVSFARNTTIIPAMGSADSMVTAIVSVNGSTDTISLYGLVAGTGTDQFSGGSAPYLTYLAIQFVGP